MFRLFFLLFSLAFISLSHAGNSRWQWVTGWESDGLRWDSDTVLRNKDGTIRVWVRMHTTDKINSALADSGLIKREEVHLISEGRHGFIIRCATQEYAIFYSSWTRLDGSIASFLDFPRESWAFKPLEPESGTEAVAKTVCKVARNK